MRKIKFSGTLSLDKKTIAKLSDDQLDNIQGGMAACTCDCCSCDCSNSCNSCINCNVRAGL